MKAISVPLVTLLGLLSTGAVAAGTYAIKQFATLNEAREAHGMKIQALELGQKYQTAALRRLEKRLGTEPNDSDP